MESNLAESNFILLQIFVSCVVSSDVPGAEPVGIIYSDEMEPKGSDGLFRAVKPMKGGALQLNPCRHCGGYNKRGCSRTCAAHAYKYFWCDTCECQCHDNC